MEVSGRKEPINVDSGRAVIFCQPCQSDNESVPAEGYCETCNEFICTSCIKAHRKLATTKNHVIKSKGDMPTVQTQSDPITELCAVHKTEIVKFYCKEHDCVGCGDCMVLEHKSCNVQLVSDVSGNYGNSDELIILRHSIDHLRKNLAACKHEITQSLKVAEETKIKVIEEIKKFREEMSIYLNNVQADLIQKVEQMSSKNISTQQKLQDKCESLGNEMKEFQSKLNQYSDKINQLFVLTKQIQKRLRKLQEENDDISSKSKITTCTFEPSKAMTDFKVNISPFGKLSSQTLGFTGPCKKSIIGMKAHFEKKVNVQEVKERNCYITGITMLSPDEILIADSNNLSLKIVNVSQGKITSTYKLSSIPMDVTVTNADTAAVTLPDEGKILIMNTRNGLSESRSVKVRERCAGIDYKNNIMAVSFCSPPAVQVLDMTGNIVHEVHDTSILQMPCYISLGNDNESMFVSDFKKQEVLEFTVDGHLKSTINSKKLNRPAGLVVTCDGTVVVCEAGEEDQVSMIIPGTREILLLMLQDVHVVRQICILVCEEQNKLFICEQEGSKDSNYVKIFDLK